MPTDCGFAEVASLIDWGSAGREFMGRDKIPDPAVRTLRIGGRFPVAETDAMLAALETNFKWRVTRLDHDRVALSAVNAS